jgi:hypothetical protein
MISDKMNKKQFKSRNLMDSYDESSQPNIVIVNNPLDDFK